VVLMDSVQWRRER